MSSVVSQIRLGLIRGAIGFDSSLAPGRLGSSEKAARCRERPMDRSVEATARRSRRSFFPASTPRVCRIVRRCLHEGRSETAILSVGCHGNDSRPTISDSRPIISMGFGRRTRRDRATCGADVRNPSSTGGLLVSSSAMGKPPASAWGPAGRIVGFGLAGSITLALVGFVQALVAYPAFMAVERRLLPSTGSGEVMTAVTSGLPPLQAALGIVVGAIAFAILGVPRPRRQGSPQPLGRSLVNGLLGTSVGVVMGILGGLTLGWRISPSPQGLFMGYFYGSLTGFLLGFVTSVIASARARRDVHT